MPEVKPLKAEVTLAIRLNLLDGVWIDPETGLRLLATLDERDAEIARLTALVQHLESWQDRSGQRYDLTNPEASVQPLADGLERVAKELYKAESLLASTTDLANTWAREVGVVEAYNERELKALVDRLWTRLSLDNHRLTRERDEARTWANWPMTVDWRRGGSRRTGSARRSLSRPVATETSQSTR